MKFHHLIYMKFQNGFWILSIHVTSPFFLGGHNDDHVPTLAPASSSHTAMKSRMNKQTLHLLPTSLKPWTSQQPGIEDWGVISYHCSSFSTLALFEQWNEPLSQGGQVKLTQLVGLSTIPTSCPVYTVVLWYISAGESAVVEKCHVVNARAYSKCATQINKSCRSIASLSWAKSDTTTTTTTMMWREWTACSGRLLMPQSQWLH